MNIIFGVVVVAMDLVIMCVRGETLSNLNTESKTMRADAAAQDGVILEMSDVYKGGGDGSNVSTGKHGGGDGSGHEVDKTGDEDIIFTANPMQGAGARDSVAIATSSAPASAGTSVRVRMPEGATDLKEVEACSQPAVEASRDGTPVNIELL